MPDHMESGRPCNRLCSESYQNGEPLMYLMAGVGVISSDLHFSWEGMGEVQCVQGDELRCFSGRPDVR